MSTLQLFDIIVSEHVYVNLPSTGVEKFYEIYI